MPFLMSNTILQFLKKPESLGELLDSKTGQEIHKMRLEHLTVAENKGSAQKENTHTNTMGACGRDSGVKQESPQWPKLEQFEEQNKVVLYDNPKHKVKIHEPGFPRGRSGKESTCQCS